MTRSRQPGHRLKPNQDCNMRERPRPWPEEGPFRPNNAPEVGGDAVLCRTRAKTLSGLISPMRETENNFPSPEIPHGPGAVARIAVRKEIEARLKSAAAVWLYGSSGDGKTTLALETARASNRTWSIIELRECDPQTVLKRLRDARHCVSEPSFGGIILDDLPLAALGRAKLELSILAEAVRRSDGVLVCTAYLQPPPSFDVGSFSPSVMKAPYLTDDEVSAMILASGGDAKLWTPLIQLSCHNGHPQLVAARVSGLRSRIGHRGKDWRALLHQCRSLILTPSVMLYEVVC
jgi:hypothetical protein